MNLRFTSMLAAFLCLSLNSGFAQVSDISDKKFKMEINGHTLKIPYYSNHNLFTTNPNIDKAVIVIHGSNRDAGPYLENLKVAASHAPTATANTLMVAPQLLTEDDIDAHSLDAEHLYWTSGGWKSGSNSRNEFSNPRPERIPSYAVLDSVLFHIAEQFPNIESIVFTGHSAGGQVTQRMAATSPMADLLCMDFDISTRFVVVNPSSYVYMDNQRKTSGSITQFSTPSSCSPYNEWKYGLDDLYTYPARVGVDSIRRMYKRKEVTYLLGEEDNNPNSSSLDTSCEADLQGEHRFERGQVYFNYLQHYYGNTITANHKFLTVPNAGHNNLDMFDSPNGRLVLFEQASTFCGSIVNVVQPLNNHEVGVYPNPARDILSISISSSIDDNYQVSFFDLQGRLIIKQGIKAQDKVNISSLNPGMYIVWILSEEVSVYKSIIVE